MCFLCVDGVSHCESTEPSQEKCKENKVRSVENVVKYCLLTSVARVYMRNA